MDTKLQDDQRPPPYAAVAGTAPPAGSAWGAQAAYQQQPAPHQPYYQQQAPIPPPQQQHDLERNEIPNSGGGFSGRFSEKSIRHAFIRKVYLILTAQLLVTLAFVCLFTFVDSMKRFVQKNIWFYYLSFGVFIVTYIVLVCCGNVRRRTPGNFVALSIFTLAFSYMTGTISSFYNTSAVFIAVGITAGVALALTLFASQTKIDFTLCSGLIFVVSIVFMLTGLACMIYYFVAGPSRIVQCVYAGLGVLVFSLYLVYDTQLILGGRRYEIDEEEYVYGALQLYLDIVNMFLMLLSLVGGRN